jgi:hypothetical protein
MNVKAKPVGRADLPDDARVVLDHLQVRGQDYSARRIIQFTTIGSRLVKCRFDNVTIDAAQFGCGRQTSEFVDCTFNGARIVMGPGGLSRFIGCTFQNVELRQWICFAVEVIDCTFGGELRMAIFNGTISSELRDLAGRDRNEFSGNDFSAMDLINVTFRTGIDLTRQRLPRGRSYLYLPDAAGALGHARSAVMMWQDLGLRRPALAIVDGLLADVRGGQRQLLLRPKDYLGLTSLPPEAVEKTFALLGYTTGEFWEF